MYIRQGIKRIIHNAISKYGLDNFSFEYYYLPNFCKKDLTELEELMIERYDSLKPSGYNLLPRANGYEGGKTSEELKELRKTLNTKDIHQYDPLTGEYIKTYFSSEEAARQLGVTSPSITSVANGNRKTAHGFIWSYEQNECVVSVEKIGTTHSKIIRQHSLDGNIFIIFPSLRDAAKEVNGNHNNICNACNGKTKVSYGYRWSYG